MARGLSNGEIVDELVLSQATAKTHVKRVLAKLNLRDRVQAVVLAYEAGVVTPDHTIRTKNWPLVVAAPEEVATVALADAAGESSPLPLSQL